jgi:voltage-gated potassium channel
VHGPQRLRRRPKPFNWRERMRRAVASRRVFPYLAFMTVALGLVAGFVVTLVDRKDFPTFGTGVWWAIVTLGTVGYGDVVPHTAWGRVLGSLVIVIGVTFLAFLTATVTSYFVAAEEEEADAAEREALGARLAEAGDSLRRIEERLTAIEAKLER